MLRSIRRSLARLLPKRIPSSLDFRVRTRDSETIVRRYRIVGVRGSRLVTIPDHPDGGCGLRLFGEQDALRPDLFRRAWKTRQRGEDIRWEDGSRFDG